MSVDFYWDNTGLAKNAATAIEILTGQRSSFIRDSFAGLWGSQPPQWPDLPGAEAFLMMGTTDELQTALRVALSQGIAGIQIPDDNMAIWYVRRKAGTFTKSVVSIAPLQRYWGVGFTQTQAEQPGGWYWLWTGTIRTNENIKYITLQDLADQVLPRAKGVDAWL